MKVAYRHVDLDDNDEAQYCWFYPLTNKMKYVSHDRETHVIPDDQLDEFHKYWIKVEVNNCTAKVVDQSSHDINKSFIMKDDAQKLLSPFAHVELHINTSENTLGGGRKTKSNFKLNVNQAQTMRDMLDGFIKRNT